MTVNAEQVAAPIREMASRRVYLFLFILIAVYFSYISYAEGDMLVTSADDIATAILGSMGILFVALRWKKKSLGELKKTNNILFVVGLWLLVFSVFALEIENGFPDELADDIPKLLITAGILANRVL